SCALENVPTPSEGPNQPRKSGHTGQCAGVVHCLGGGCAVGLCTDCTTHRVKKRGPGGPGSGAARRADLPAGVGGHVVLVPGVGVGVVLLLDGLHPFQVGLQPLGDVFGRVHGLHQLLGPADHGLAHAAVLHRGHHGFGGGHVGGAGVDHAGGKGHGPVQSDRLGGVAHVAALLVVGGGGEVRLGRGCG